MRRMRLHKRQTVALVLCLLGAAVPSATAGPSFPPTSSESAQGIITFRGSPPSDAQLSSLRELGLEAQGFERLPMAIVRGTSAQVSTAIALGIGSKYYPDEQLTYSSSQSNHAINLEPVHALGFTGKGIQVALVDTGVDATHPDLTDHVVHNVKMVDPDYAGGSDAFPGSIVVPVDEGPYSNTDDSGHGTLVAGVIAADGTTDPAHIGVAPDVDLISYSIGVGATFMTTAVAAYDHILSTPEWGIDVVNNSWGTSTFSLYDPDHPINVATKMLTDSGIATVFSAGNGGAGEAEMTMNPFAQAPWNISVAGSDVSGRRWSESSNGLTVDDSVPAAPTEGHVRFEGDRIGMYHPTITAPAAEIETTCGLGRYSICEPGKTGTASGTSLAAPHVSGIAALLKQARPNLGVGQLRATLEASARPTLGTAPLWQVGYGLVDAEAAVQLVLKPNFEHKLEKEHEAAEARILDARLWSVPASELWTWTPSAATGEMVVDGRELRFPVPAGTDAIKVAISYFSNGGATDYSVTVKDASGQEVGITTPSTHAGVSTLLVDLRDADPDLGDWTLQVDGRLALVDDELESGRVTVQAALLEAQEAETPPRFVADGNMPLAFTPDLERTTGLASPEGCDIEAGAPKGLLTPPAEQPFCHSGQTGFVMSNFVEPAEFTSEPLERSIVLGGQVSLVMHLVDATRLMADALGTRAMYELDEISADGSVAPLASGVAMTGGTDGRNVGTFEIPSNAVAAGSRLRFRLTFPGAYSSGARMLFGGQSYGDAGITLTVGHMEAK